MPRSRKNSIESAELQRRCDKRLEFIKDILLYLWQLPQNLLGLGMMRAMAPGEERLFRGCRVLRSEKMRGGISLGKYIVISKQLSSPVIERHEWGHARQSRLLGPFYLPIIGLPSLLWAAWWKPGMKVDYFAFYTERWADRLAGIRRISSAGRGTPPRR